MSAPVDSSAAMPCTAQNIEPKGFLLIHLLRTETEHLSALINLTLTPHKKADGRLTERNRLSFLGDYNIVRFIIPI